MTLVKLGVVDLSFGEVPRFYRRLSLPFASLTCFLKQHAVLLSRGEDTGDIRNVDLNEYQVQLSYMDKEGDRILICDDSDVNSAYSCKPEGVLKIMATVQSKQSTKSTQTFVPTNETGTQPKAPDVADALADLVHCAVASANAGLSAALPPGKVAKVERKIQKAARTSSEALEKALEQASKQTVKAAGYAEDKVSKAVKKAEKNMLRTEKKVEEALAALSKAAAAKQRAASIPEPVPSSAPEASEPPKSAEEELFIHGRHTCDACLTTPIIGKRFHATNMKDYDLCETCHDQYKGNEITFEVAELERDVGMQDRWRRKFDLIKKHGRHAHHGRPSAPHCPRRGPRPHHGPPHHRRPQPPHFGTTPLPFHFGPPPPHRGVPLPPVPHPPPPPAFVAPPPPPPPAFVPPRPSGLHELNSLTENGICAFEAAMNEAIRLSKEEHNTNSVQADSTADPALDAAIRKSLMEASAPAEEEVEAPEAVVDASSKFDSDSQDKSDGATAEEEPEIKVEPAKMTEDQDASCDRLQEEEAVEIPVEKVPATPKILASFAAGEECNESTAETGVTIVSGKSDHTNHSSPNNAAKTSFVEQDSGSTENFLGETLDRVADAIDNLMIVDGDDDGEEELESQGSWSVVHEDENLAHATSMIGSALFHSDNNVGSQVSSVSSVPTTVRSIVNPAQQARWANHLERLHELGFDDDEKNVSVLEMLMAANIGVESDDDVTIEQVVNALMNRND